MPRRSAVLLAVALVSAGCGNEQTKPPDAATPDPPRGERVVRLSSAGVTFTAPFNWPDLPPQGQLVGGIQNKRATVAIWHYARSEPLPRTRAQLQEVERYLVERVKRRDPTFTLRDSAFPRRDGARSIELVGEQTIAGLRLGVRSAHVYSDGAEIVFDAYAPPEHFERVDRTVFQPLLSSLKLSKQ